MLFTGVVRRQKCRMCLRIKPYKKKVIAVHPTTPKNLLSSAEICAVSRISKKEIGRCFKLILKALETSVDLITTGDFMSRFCSNLGLPKQVQMAATFIARKAVELDLVPGRSPISVAAAAIYMASQASAEKKTQKGKRLWTGVRQQVDFSRHF